MAYKLSTRTVDVVWGIILYVFACLCVYVLGGHRGQGGVKPR